MIYFGDYFSPISIIVTILLLYLYNWYKRPANFPPGPRGVPLLGVLPFMGKYPEKVLKKWSKNYGAVMGVRFGPNDLVVLNDFDAIQQVYCMLIAN